MEDKNRLVIEGLTKFFGQNRILSDISFEVAEGEFCVLLGPSGSGKSVLLRMIAGLEKPSSGKIFMDGLDVTDVPPGKRDIAMVFQNYAIYPHMTVFDNIAFPLWVRKMPADEIRNRVHEVASLLQLNRFLERKPAELSGGQRQRVAMGRAIVRKPKIFLFDEPLSNLDAKLRGSMRIEMMLLHRKLQATTVYVTHDQVEAMTMADTIAVLEGGVIQQIDSPENIYNRPANLTVAEFIGNPPMNFIKGILNHDSEGTVVFTSNSFNFKRKVELELEGEVVAGIRPEHISIDSTGKWQGIVTFVENVGSDKFVHAELLEGPKFIIRTTPELDPKIGETVPLLIDETRISIFWQDKRII
ncbi:ABC transporter ATP-binding protein [Desulfomonile tiedjei]|uniref:ATPase component of ABC-type sugar transporter n=1 Tax=Desulfomonile tiedjei (strain ATCC 49306 / DSM 6799 / DCB-1) TaxID=706587 RepID=I4C351_DESTA|nr:ABC transporter ATP-binding protein [Desulfomonile tiedjei]AFM23992.1 ATPase component of ABC-type sugar transporter [Desulfomonile tiedjei DSM 6799]